MSEFLSFLDSRITMLYILIYFSILVFVLVRLLRKSSGRYATIVVVGDIGRSPRMQYHAISLADENVKTTIIGYLESVPHSSVVKNRKICLKPMKEFPIILSKLPRLIVLCLKVLWQSLTLFLNLIFSPKPKYVILQSAPALPAMAVCWLACRLRGSYFMIDWHNYSYTILALSLGSKHPFVKFAKWFEHLFGRCADLNLCVTNAMKLDLDQHWGISAVVLYDRPADIFHSIDLKSRHQLFQKLATSYNQLDRFTEQIEDGSIRLKPSRPAIIISSTSWTEDEDFGLLLDALEKYDQTASNESAKILCVITGKGPQKAHYLSLINSKRSSWHHIDVLTPWLEADDYPKMLASADLGICLHKSSSGVDLPMKVVDMFGCCLPVCAVDYFCISELVKVNENGLLFQDQHQLASQLKDLLSGFPKENELLTRFRLNLESNFSTVRWPRTWKQIVWPLLSDLNLINN